jgi:hypothetical protein
VTLSQFAIRSEVSIVIAAVLPVWAAYALYRSEKLNRQPDPYQVELQTERLAPVRNITPDNAVLGFITDIPEQQVSLFQSLYYGAQYSLAPRLLERNPNHHFVLGMFTNAANLNEAAAHYHLRLVRYFGNGTVLLQNEAQ